MFKKILAKRAQSTAEYAIIVGLVIGAVAAMQLYVKRGLQNKIRNVVDAGMESKAQFEPYYYGPSTSNSIEDATTTKTRNLGGAEVEDNTGFTSSDSDQTVRGISDAEKY